MAVLLKNIGLHIIARSQTAPGTGRIVVGKHFRAKRGEFRTIPNRHHIVIEQIAENFGGYGLIPPARKAFVAVPEKIAGGYISVPRYKRAPLLDEAAFPPFLEGQFR